jgi:hypothetical protein
MWKAAFVLPLPAIPPEMPVATSDLCTTARSSQGRVDQGAATGEPLPASTAVRLSTTGGRLGGLGKEIV